MGLGAGVGDATGLGLEGGPGLGLSAPGDAPGTGLAGTGEAAGDAAGDGLGRTGTAGRADGEGDGEGDGVGSGLGMPPGGGVQERETPRGVSCAFRSAGAGCGASTFNAATVVKPETWRPARARAATRTVVPGAGSGTVSRSASPGATLRVFACDTFAKSPSVSARRTSTSSTVRPAPPVVTVGAVYVSSTSPPRWARARAATPWGVRGNGATGSPRLPHAGRAKSAARAQATRSPAGAVPLKE